MFHGGKYVLAPIVANDQVIEVNLDQVDGSSYLAEEQEVAAHETVETHDRTDERLRRLEEMIKNVSGSSARGRAPDTVPVTNNPDQSGRSNHEPSFASSSAERGGNIRWDLIPKFPTDIASNKLWEAWQSYIENFEIAVSLSTFTGQAERAKLLYLSLGTKLQDIINAANLHPNYPDPRCYSTLVEGINTYFRSMTDTAAEHEAFQAMRQAKGETIVTFHARLTQKVRLCGYSTLDQSRFVLAQLLKGMENRKLAMTARTYGHDAIYVVQAATRVEAYETGEQDEVPHNSTDILAVDQKRLFRRDDQPFSKARKIEDSMNERDGKFPSNSKEYRPGRRTRCWRCGFTFHKGKSCPAKNKECNSCGRIGHYAGTCRSNARQNRVNNVQHEPRKPLPHGWMKDSDEQV